MHYLRVLFICLTFNAPIVNAPVAFSQDRFVGAQLSNVPDSNFPKSAMVINVQASPYLAQGNGQADDSAAIQRALDDTMGLGKVLYFPAGTYLVSGTLRWSKKNSAGRDAWGFNYLQGVNAEKAIIRLRDGTFTDTSNPQSIMWCGGFGSADWFHNYVQGLTFDVGKNNPAAIALQFYSNNSGAVRDCRFVGDATSGWIGLDLGHSDMNGPLLVRNCEFNGYRRAISTGHAVNGQTFEHITLRDQSQMGISNEGQTISIRGLLSHNQVPALTTYGTCCLIDSQLFGHGNSSRNPAIVNFNSGRVYVRDVHTHQYARALADLESPDSAAAYRLSSQDQPESVGPTLAEYWSSNSNKLRNTQKVDWRLPIEEPPPVVYSPVESWANVDDFGADPSGQQDSSAAIQQAIDSGASTVFFPGSYALQHTVIVRGQARRLVGIGGWIDYKRQVTPDFRIDDGAGDSSGKDTGSITIEHIANVHGGVEVNTNRTIVFRSVSDCDLKFTPKARSGRLFLEDFVTHNLAIEGARVWARQLNVENEGTHVTNSAGQLWILGLKTERGGTLLLNRSGGRSEVLGGFSYTTTAGKLAPMFINDNASLFTYFTEICFNGDPFQTLLVERNQGQAQTFLRDQVSTLPYRSK